MTVKTELHQYLGDGFEPKKLTWDDAFLRRELTDAGSAASFWGGRNVLYLHAVASTDDWRLPYLKFVRETVPPPVRLLEYHAGVGNFGLQLGEGYDAAYAEDKSPCAAFLQWRLKQRKSKAPIYGLDDNIPVYPLVLGFDAIQRYEEDAQWSFIQRLAELGETVIINMDTRDFTHKGILWPVDLQTHLARIQSEYTLTRHVTVNFYTNLVSFQTSARIEVVEE